MAEDAEPEAHRLINTASAFAFLDETPDFFKSMNIVLDPRLIPIRTNEHGKIELLVATALMREDHGGHATQANVHDEADSKRYTILEPVLSTERGTILKQLDEGLKEVTGAAIKTVVRAIKGPAVRIGKVENTEEDIRRIPVWYLVELTSTENLEAGGGCVEVQWFSEKKFNDRDAIHPSDFVYSAYTTLQQVFPKQKSIE